MNSLLIVGAGGYGYLVKDIAESEFEQIDFLDDNSPNAVGKISDLEKLQLDCYGVVVAIGNPTLREQIFQRVSHPVTVIHPKAVVSNSAVIQPGCVIEANSVISPNVVVKEGCFICAGAVVNHDAVVNAFCQIDCNAVVESSAVVPAGTKVESCAVFRRSTKT